MIEFFAGRFADRYQRPRWQPDPDALKEFCEYSWPGNIRQLQHVIEQGYVLDAAPMLPSRVHASARNNRCPSRI